MGANHRSGPDGEICEVGKYVVQEGYPKSFCRPFYSACL